MSNEHSRSSNPQSFSSAFIHIILYPPYLPFRTLESDSIGPAIEPFVPDRSFTPVHPFKLCFFFLSLTSAALIHLPCFPSHLYPPSFHLISLPKQNSTFKSLTTTDQRWRISDQLQWWKRLHSPHSPLCGSPASHRTSNRVRLQDLGRLLSLRLSLSRS